MHVAVMCPVFGEVAHVLDGGQPEPSDFRLAARLCSEMSNAFETEGQRASAVRPLLGELFRGPGVDFGVLEVAAKKGTSDGTARYERRDMVTNVEFKNEKGAGGADAYMENASYYVHFWANSDEPAKQCCPSLLVEVVGQDICLSGAAWCVGFPCLQPLSDSVPFVLSKLDTRLVLRQARLVMALRVGFEGLCEWYRKRSTLRANPQAQFPDAREVLINGQTVQLCYLRFLHDGQGRDAGFAKPLFVARREDTGCEVLIKFCPHRYGQDAHEMLALRGCAPALYGTRSVGHFTMVVMELVEGTQWHGPTHRDRYWETLSSALGAFHDAGMVHGDLRSPNLMVNGDRVMVLDFDWAGRAGEVRYPCVLNHKDICWPEGADIGALISRAHDEEMLRALRGDSL